MLVTYDGRDEQDTLSGAIEGRTVTSSCTSIHGSGVVIDFDSVVDNVVPNGEGPVSVDHSSSGNGGEDIKSDGDGDDDNKSCNEMSSFVCSNDDG